MPTSIIVNCLAHDRIFSIIRQEMAYLDLFKNGSQQDPFYHTLDKQKHYERDVTTDEFLSLFADSVFSGGHTISGKGALIRFAER